jgi:predicted RNA-binding Zn ribbon-like protein
MMVAETLRKAIENLVDAKLVDALARPDGLNRLLAHRRTGVASPDIRNAERRLEEMLGEMLSPPQAVPDATAEHAEQAA